MDFCDAEKISVVVIIYNVINYLDDCVESVRNQSYQNIEIILVDDGSSDGSGKLCDQYAGKDVRIKVIHKKNGGLVSARKAGLEIATGEYVAFVDGDDWVDNDIYEKLYGFANQYHAEIVLSGIIREFPEKKKVDSCPLSTGFYEKAELEKHVYPNMMYSMKKGPNLVDASLCTKLFSRKLVKNIISTVDDNIFYFGEDAATTYPCLLNANSVYVTDYSLYHHRILSLETDRVYKRERVFERLLLFYNNIKKNFDKTIYADIMEPQLSGYFINMLNALTRESVGLDIILFTQYMEIRKKQVKRVITYKFLANDIQDVCLYGAGKVGRDYYEQLLALNINVVLWADKEYELLKMAGLPVNSIEMLRDKEYNWIILAAKHEKMANNMKKDLLDKGFEESKILWVQPVMD